LIDRHFGTASSTRRRGDQLFQHVGVLRHPEVYIMILPAFDRRRHPRFAKPCSATLDVYATASIAILSFMFGPTYMFTSAWRGQLPSCTPSHAVPPGKVQLAGDDVRAR
jgi:heme/copper-type cytochrome/quinol oxidase subunit 1